MPPFSPRIWIRRARTLGRWLSIALLLGLAFAGKAGAQVDIGQDLLGANLFAPDLILREADQIGLTDAQRDAVTSLVGSMKKTMGEGQARMSEAAGKLGKSLQAASVPDPLVFDQFASMLEIENEIKRGQFAMLIRAKNLLSAEQQDKLREIIRKHPAKGGDPKQAFTKKGSRDIRQEIDAMMQKIQSGLESWRKEGRDPARIIAVMKPFGDQMQEGKFPEAKETLSKALQRFSQTKARRAPAVSSPP